MIRSYIHNSLQLVPTLSQINPVHALPSNFKIPQYILPSTPRSPKCSPAFRVPPQKNPLCIYRVLNVASGTG